MEDEQFSARDLERRSFLKRAGLVAGATVWATPTVQSVTSAAFAAGSPAPECPPEKLIRFKFDVDGNKFDTGDPNGDPAADCLAQVDGFGTAGRSFPDGPGPTSCFVDGNCRVCVTVTLNGDHSATVTVTGGTIKDVDIKGGNLDNAKGHCTDGDPMGDGSTSVVTAPANKAAISFVGGVICPTC